VYDSCTQRGPPCTISRVAVGAVYVFCPTVALSYTNIVRFCTRQGGSRTKIVHVMRVSRRNRTRWGGSRTRNVHARAQQANSPLLRTLARTVRKFGPLRTKRAPKRPLLRTLARTVRKFGPFGAQDELKTSTKVFDVWLAARDVDEPVPYGSSTSPRKPKTPSHRHLPRTTPGRPR
jgi:hypothetical protein